MTHLFIVTALATLLFLGTHCGFAQQGQPHLTKPSGTESEDQGPPIKGGKFRIKTYFSLLEPIPGLKAAVSTESITALNKLSDDELMKRYKYFKELIEGERKNRILQPQPEEKVKEWKVELVRTFSSLQDHHIATPNEADETFAMALDSPSVADVVLANLSYVRATQTSMTENLKGKVADKQSGLALGFISTNAKDSTLELGSGEVAPIRWSFRKATAQSLPDSSMVYQIVLQVTPANFGQFKTASSQVIVDGGHLENKDWVYELRPPSGFQQQKLLVSAILQSYEDKGSFDAGHIATTDSIDVPVPEIALKAKPGRVWILMKETLRVLKQFFGIVGGIPTIILAWKGIVFAQKKRASSKKHPPKHDMQPEVE